MNEQDAPTRIYTSDPQHSDRHAADELALAQAWSEDGISVAYVWHHGEDYSAMLPASRLDAGGAESGIPHAGARPLSAVGAGRGEWTLRFTDARTYR